MDPKNKKSASVGEVSPVSLNDLTSMEPPCFFEESKEHFEANEVQIAKSR